MEYLAVDGLCERLGCKALKDEPMSAHTTFKVGGNADRLIFIRDIPALCTLVGCLNETGTPYFVLGKGSNLLVSDAGYRGVILCLEGEFKAISLEGDTRVRCGAGVSLQALCAFARDHSLTGLEFAWGIPGSAGGAAYMNAGAYGGEMKNVLVRCDHVTPEGAAGSFEGEALKLGYRTSAYTGARHIITQLTLELQKGDKEEIAAKMEELMEKRLMKQPLDFPSAGSTFKRPEGYFAAALIEECGLKGFSVGGAQVSEKHAGFIINKGGATCADILGLIEAVQEKVKAQKGVDLHCEVKLLG